MSGHAVNDGGGGSRVELPEDGVKMEITREETGVLLGPSEDYKSSEKEGMLRTYALHRPSRVTGRSGLATWSSSLRRLSLGTWLKYTSLCVLILQYSGQVLIMRYSMTRGQQPFLKTAVVFIGEMVKLVASFILLSFSAGSVAGALIELRKYLIDNWTDTLKVGVPAGIYTAQNILLYYAVENLDAGTYMVTYQLKILTTALFTVLILRRRLSVIQWVALVILCIGVATAQISAREEAKPVSNPVNGTSGALGHQQAASTHKHEQNTLLGLLVVVIACFLSGFSGIYFEKILKDSEASVWLRNFQLALLSLPIGAVVISVKDGQKVLDHGLMQGFDFVVWMVVAVQVLGGLTVAVVIKYADNILKAFATSIAIVVATVASIYIFGLYPRWLFVGGAVLVIIAVVLYGSFPYRRAVELHPVSREDEEKAELQRMKKDHAEETDLEKAMDLDGRPTDSEAEMKSQRKQ